MFIIESSLTQLINRTLLTHGNQLSSFIFGKKILCCNIDNCFIEIFIYFEFDLGNIYVEIFYQDQ